jgi:hypothetical protein
MPKLEVIDEGIINASPMAVYKAILDEYAGITHWWLPVLEFKPRGNKFDCEGAACDLAAHGSGMTAKFSVVITKIVEAKSIEFDYSGDFIGTGKWMLEPMEGKTKARYHLNVRTNRLFFSIIAPFMKNPAKPHSNTIQYGFKALNSFLINK